MGRIAIDRALESVASAVRSRLASRVADEHGSEGAVCMVEDEGVEMRCPFCGRRIRDAPEECPGCGRQARDGGFGLRPRRERQHAIIDECEEELLESGLLAAGSYLDFLDRLGPLSYLKGPLQHLLRMIPVIAGDEDGFRLLMACGAGIMIVIALILAWPHIAKGVEGLGGTLGEMLSAKPLVPG